MMELLTADERSEVLNLINNALEAKGINLVACAYEDGGFFFDVTLMKGYESRPIKEIVKSEIGSFMPESCRKCPNHPNNGGSGICFCTLGTPSLM